MSFFAYSSPKQMIELLRLIAIFLVAFSAVNTTAYAQKEVENSPAVQQTAQAERTRIAAERASAAKTLADQRKACYQKLAVTPCLNEARDIHREKTQDLKRQEVQLNDAQRKRAAADRLKTIDQRNSPQTQLSEAQRRGKALEASKKREETQIQKQTDRAAKLREAAAASAAQPKGDVSANEPTAKPLPAGKPRAEPAPKLKPELRPGQAEKMAKSREQADKREKDAEMRRAEAIQREAKRKKPAAAGLPIQD